MTRLLWGGAGGVSRKHLVFSGHILRQIFTYNEIVKFISNEEEVKLANPQIADRQGTAFSMPHSDFTRPDDAKSFANMQAEQLFQTVEGIQPEAWKRNRESILERYARLALESKINPEEFMTHMRKVMEKEFHGLWNRDNTQWSKGQKYYIEQAERTKSILATVVRHSPISFLNDDFLAQYYSRTDQITDEGVFIYSDEEGRLLTVLQAKRLSPTKNR